MAVAAAALDAPPAARRSRARPSPYWLLLLPLVVPLVLLYLVPLGRVLWISFTDPAPGFANYERLMAFPALQRVLWTTLRVGATTTAIALALGYLVAYVMARAGPRHRLWLT